MSPELSPHSVLAAHHAEPPLNGPWHVRWDRLAATERANLLRTALPATVVVRTSGSTGKPAEWQRSREQLISEAEMLADLWRDSRLDLILAFAPPVHLYGLLTTVLVPAVLGVEVRYQPGFDVPVPPVAGRAVGVAAIPWTFRILARHRPAFAGVSSISVLHSTATLPASAAEFAASIRPGRVAITEIFGSTETGGIAHRRRPDEVWTLFDDVTLVHEETSGEVPLVVSSPRLAGSLTRWRTGDWVEVLDERHLLFRGRRERLRKINGVRVDLDEVQHRLIDSVPCADLACVPVDDPVRGENFSVLVVAAGSSSADLPSAVRRVAKSMGLAPEEVRLVTRIDRDETGKLRA